MEHRQSWKSSVVYQIYPRSFMDSNGDGIGDIQGIISKLDYLKDLGINTLWLSPVYQSPNDDNGYDISNYLDIHPDFGTMNDMDQLIFEAKQRGIKIIMDLVINHTSDEHPWFIQSKDKKSPYRDYYIWKDKPNNWTSFFSGSAWDQIGDSYYLHLFSKKQPDLNWNNPKVMEEIKDIMRFWLDKGIYGFRCDVINIIYKSSLEDGKRRLVLVGREFYHSQEGCHQILKTLRKDVLSKYDCMTVGETVLVNTAQANDLILPEREELDMVFGFEHMETDQINNKWFKTRFKPQKFMKVIAKWQEEVYWNANYLENHDQPRSITRFGNDQKYHEVSAKMLATLLLTLKGTPYIFEGQEIGMTNADIKRLEDYRDIETHRIVALAKKLHFPQFYIRHMLKTASRDNARQPMQWKKEGGFTTGIPWLKMNENMSFINVEDNLKNTDSILRHYQQLISLRQNHDVLIDGSFKPLYMKHNVFIFERKLNETSWITVSNLSGNKKRIPKNIKGSILLSNMHRTSLSNPVLMPYESILIDKEKTL